MCGFHGSTSGQTIGRLALSHRGPDNYAQFKAGSVVLEHWRLSIIDLSANGNQPMAIGDDGGYVIAYNGEVYNFRELRDRLSGIELKSGSDTEVVLRLYEQVGLEFLRDLNGMFALAIYDRARKRIVLARDRFGIKPLYYHVDGQSNLTFASELKALLFNSSIGVSLDIAAIQSLFHLLYIEGERTPFNEIKKLEPGCFLVYELETKQVTISKYHEFTFGSSSLSEAQCLDSIDHLLSESVKAHLLADVPVGALLSGGVDSSLMVAMMSRHSANLLTYSVGYADNQLFDESKYFNQVAEQYGTTHHHKVLRAGDLGSLVEEVATVLDEPVGDTSVLLNYFIFGFVSQSVKVCLSGLGGDELFGGYNRYLACKLLPAYLGVPKRFRDTIRSLISLLPSSRDSRAGNKIRLVKTFLMNADSDLGRAYCNFIDYFANAEQPPVVSGERFTNTRFDAYWDDALIEELNRIYKYDIENYMVNDLLFLTDRMSMRHSIEARVPYLENRLVEFALSIPPDQKIKHFTLKHPLKKVAQRYLPDEVIFRKKRGFSSPVAGILSPERLSDLARELTECEEEYVAILNRDLFLSMIAQHRQGKEDFSLQIFTLMVYLKWMEDCYRRMRNRRSRPHADLLEPS
jgi:asparagine synthase (glutamine-hydrolysing)